MFAAVDDKYKSSASWTDIELCAHALGLMQI